MADEAASNLRALVAEVAAAFFANSHVGVTEIGSVIDQIAKSLVAVGAGSDAPPSPREEPPAVTRVTTSQIRRSITPEALVSFEDGRSYKTLRRHLAVRGLTPEQYREKWGLPADYSMVASGYSARRSQLAEDLGLGARRAPPTRSRRRQLSANTNGDG